MSADNYIAIQKINDRYAVWMDFASNEKPNPLNKGAKYFKTYDEALTYASRWYNKETIVEYGIIDLDDERHTALLKEEKELTRREMQSTMAEVFAEKKSIFNMDLHELMAVRKNVAVLKVYDGWLYKWGDSQPVFVPSEEKYYEVRTEDQE